MDLARELKVVKHEGDSDSRCPWNNLEESGKETQGTGDSKKNLRPSQLQHYSAQLEYWKESFFFFFKSSAILLYCF